ncbi:unnamed protein product [Ostreobium quekettii]|uniref:Serine/threonine-protein phosphatase 2A activator n=1 Tax=Ostreobium quekettii TaxID=121088 RepID=A0A8S1ISJ5_9CHLO|nr:unnamed protein product [Ostreobium quekettii]|eukprot:evm.model.scf_818.2 EVM.evm.TU.scf_818.2   scf_818:10010-11101(-)
MEPAKAPWASADAPPPPGPPLVRTPMPPPGRSRQQSRQDDASAIKADPHMPAACPACPDAPPSFSAPRKRIQTSADLARFLQSEAVGDFLGFILFLNEAVKGKRASDPCEVSPLLDRLLAVLDTLRQWVDEIPPVVHKLRYGNPAFRTWLGKVEANARGLVASVLPAELAGAAEELGPYLAASFGDSTRIDYGTGHETTFCAFLFCLAKLGLVGPGDCQGLVLRVFKSYLDLMRKVQTTYWLEPAGSHGVWGLDDYQFLPFVWGSGQLVDHPVVKPKSIHDADLVREMGDEYLYMRCVGFVREVKKGPLSETSPMLCDIAAVPHWAKVNSGLVKMYKAEVLGKFPIMQHFLFGSLMKFPEKGS